MIDFRTPPRVVAHARRPHAQSLLARSAAVRPTAGAMLAWLACALALALLPRAAVHAAVVEYYNPDLDNYFITADPVEQAFVDGGGVGNWLRTGGAFATGGPSQVCRFSGNSATNPATGTFFGPNSHFYTADPAECALLKSQYVPNAKSWQFESNDFATTPAVNGACPSDLVPIYRAYNNGFARGVDSNHRITSSYAAYRQTVAAGSIGEGIVMCAPRGLPQPEATAAGSSIGAAASATIGPAGGTLSTPDGQITLTIPAGALDAPVTIGIEPVTNLAHGGTGTAYRLTPDGQVFSAPVTITFAYVDADLDGTAIDFLGLAFQTASGFWYWAGTPSVDANARTVSVASTHFSTWSKVKGLQILPASKTLRVNDSTTLKVVVCYQIEVIDPLGDPLASPGMSCKVDQGIVSTLSINEWSVNGQPGGGSVYGRVTGRDQFATYFAPSSKPTPDTVAVSARVHNPLKGPSAKTLVVSNIRIVEDQWIGTATLTTVTSSASAQVTWNLDSVVNGVATYKPTGSVSATLPPCTLNPSSAAVTPGDVTLVVDYNAEPPTYHGKGAVGWTAVYNCPAGSQRMPFFTPFFGGSKGDGTEAQGTVSADGSAIEGSDVYKGTVNGNFAWKFTRAGQ